MPEITVPGEGTFEVAEDTRLVNAIEDNGIDIMHRCGGHARCTTCRVQLQEGEPERMTSAERERLQKALLLGKIRLSCQILCDHDMTVQPIYRVSTGDDDEPGPRPKDHITPDPYWVDAP